MKAKPSTDAVCANPKCGHPLAKHHPGCTVIVSQENGKVLFCPCGRWVEKAKEAA